MTDKKHGPVRRLFKQVMSHAAGQGWLVGMMDAAISCLQAVLDDAKENQSRVPNDKLSAEAVAVLSKTISDIRGLAAKLAEVASGEGDK